MKKVIAALSAAVLVISLVSMVFAAEKKGTIKSVDEKAGTVVFCPEGTNEDMTLKADKGVDLGSVKAGEKVEVSVENDTMTSVKKAKKAMPAIGC